MRDANSKISIYNSGKLRKDEVRFILIVFYQASDNFVSIFFAFKDSFAERIPYVKKNVYF